MHHIPASKIQISRDSKKTILSPLRVCYRTVDKKMPEKHEDKHRAELHALRKRPAHNDGGNNGKSQLRSSKANQDVSVRTWRPLRIARH